MVYQLLKNIVGLSFNLFSLLLRGGLPPFACVSIIVKEDARYLVIERANGEYVFPGGFMRWREEPLQAARREGKEETGFDLQIEDFVGYQPYASHSLLLPSNLTLIYRAVITGGTMRGSFEGKPLWLAEDEIRERLSPITQEMLDIYQHYCTQQPVAPKTSQKPAT
ncbi:MAG TPA: NUDIX hydrolase [Ktedonobacteraceae bacterium]